MRYGITNLGRSQSIYWGSGAQHKHRVAVLISKYGSAGAPIKAPVCKRKREVFRPSGGRRDRGCCTKTARVTFTISFRIKTPP